MLPILAPTTDLDETAEDPHVLKAVFMAGAGGSGKSKVAKAMFSGTGLRYINQDDHLERFMKAAGEPLSRVGARYDLFKRAQNLKNKQIRHFSRARAGIIVDVTGWDAKRVLGPRKKLVQLGYDTFMVFVRTSLETALRRNAERERRVPESYIRTAWEGSLRNLPKFRNAFGASNFLIVDNDSDIGAEDWARSVEPTLHRAGMKFLSRPIENTNGRRWLEKRKALRDTPDDEFGAGLDLSGLAKGRRNESRWERYERVLTEAQIEFSDRYSAAGKPYPDPKTVCPGQCEGMGVVPISEDETEEPWRALWLEAERKEPSGDGWHFVKCPTCDGTGKRKPKRESVRVVLPSALV